MTERSAPNGNDDSERGPATPEALRRSRRRNRMPLLIVLVLTLIGVGTVFYDVFAPTTEEPLSSSAHTAVAHACDTTFHTLKALPPLTHRTTRAELASRVVQENSIFSAMTRRFDQITTPNHDGQTALRDWTADWRAVLQRRTQYAGQLRATSRHINFVVPISSAGAPVTDRMNQYSRTHDLNQCLTENLQLETLDTIRQYPATDTQSDN